MQPVTAWSSKPSMARAPAEAPIRPEGLAAEEVLSRGILRFEPAVRKGKGNRSHYWAVWWENVLCFSTCFFNDTVVLSSFEDPGAPMKTPLTLSWIGLAN